MGLLDDAIREHLDLKRRRGADPAEIERAEREALGPVRREAPLPVTNGVELGAAPHSDAPDLPAEDVEFTVAAAADVPTDTAPRRESEGLDAPATAVHAFDDDMQNERAPHEDVLGEGPAPTRDYLDPPTGAPIAGMPPDSDAKPKRRHLFGRRHHDDPVEPEPLEPLPAHDDPFAELAADAPMAAEAPFAPEIPLAPGAAPGSERPAAAAPEPARETEPGEAVGRARPIRRDEPDSPPAPEPSAAADVAATAPKAPAPPPLKLTPEPEPGPTVEYNVEAAFADEVDGTEDILEETPEFLADTPDHDRLWFEQKPPPDYDFDN